VDILPNLVVQSLYNSLHQILRLHHGPHFGCSNMDCIFLAAPTHGLHPGCSFIIDCIWEEHQHLPHSHRSMQAANGSQTASLIHQSFIARRCYLLPVSFYVKPHVPRLIQCSHQIASSNREMALVSQIYRSVDIPPCYQLK
jgi:hypothetical protein